MVVGEEGLRQRVNPLVPIGARSGVPVFIIEGPNLGILTSQPCRPFFNQYLFGLRSQHENELNPLDRKLDFRDEERKSSERLLGKPEKESTSNEHRLSVISETCSDR